MPKKMWSLFIILSILLLLFSGCSSKVEDGSTYITLMSVPTKATIPSGLRLDSILSITNTDSENPDAPPITTLIGVFGFTNSDGEVKYYVYGQKQTITGETKYTNEEGFYSVNYLRDNDTVSLSLKDSNAPLYKVNPGTGMPTSYNNDLPLSFYAPTEQLGVYSFTDPSGSIMLRVYSTFLGINGNFFPATDDGIMVSGSLPINLELEEIINNQGSVSASKVITTPINCNNIQFIYEI
jgi:hypothetical protein